MSVVQSHTPVRAFSIYMTMPAWIRSRHSLFVQQKAKLCIFTANYKSSTNGVIAGLAYIRNHASDRALSNPQEVFTVCTAKTPVVLYK